MMLDLLRDIVDASLVRAAAALDEIHLAQKFTKAMLADASEFRRLKLGYAARTTAAMLFADVHGSTVRAAKIGARNTYLTMHAVIPTLAKLTEEFGGYVVGFRGDGLLAALGIDETGAPNRHMEPGAMVREAFRCGKGMLEAIDKVVNPALDALDIPSVDIGVG